MDLATIVGFVGGLTLVVGAMSLAGPLGTFWDLTSLLIVLGGSVFSTLMKMPMKAFTSAMKATAKSFKSDNMDPSDLIENIVALADTARKNSILALEKETSDYEFLNKSIKYMVDGLEPDVIDKIMTSEMKAIIQRHKNARFFFEAVAEACPAFGMIGTVIGLIVMMTKLQDAAAVGPAMAVALVTTLYGVMFANLLFGPLGVKLKFVTEEETMNMQIVREGIQSIIKGENPRAIKVKLESLLAPADRSQEE